MCSVWMCLILIRAYTKTTRLVVKAYSNVLINTLIIFINRLRHSLTAVYIIAFPLDGAKTLLSLVQVFPLNKTLYKQIFFLHMGKRLYSPLTRYSAQFAGL